VARTYSGTTQLLGETVVTFSSTSRSISDYPILRKRGRPGTGNTTPTTAPPTTAPATTAPATTAPATTAPATTAPATTAPATTAPATTAPATTAPATTAPVTTAPPTTAPAPTPTTAPLKSASYDPKVLPPSGYPGPDTTGIPAGMVLKPSGSLIITVDGTVIDGLNVNGCISVKADNVTISRTRVHCTSGAAPVTQPTGSTGLILRDSELFADGLANATSGGNMTMLRNDMHGVIDGPRIVDNTRIEGNWIHDLVRVGTSHNDTLQSLGATGVTIRHNSLQPYAFSDPDPHNAALMLGTESGGPLSNWLVENNYIDGGNVSINMCTDAGTVTNLVFRGNSFGPNSRYDQTRLGLDRAGVTWATSNVWYATGQTATK
jgi:hypothetical protein